MPAQRRLWDSSVIIGFLAGDQAIFSGCSQIIRQAEQGSVEILVSQLAKSECAYIRGESDHSSESIIREFFGREYIITVNLDDTLSGVTRNLIRKYRRNPSIKPLDAIHFATAIQWNIPIFETADNSLLRFDRLEGNPPVSVRRPLYEDSGNF